MENDTETKTAGAGEASGKKYRMSELIAAFRNDDVELDTSDVICYVTDKNSGSLCNTDKLLMNRNDLRKILCHRGLNQIALEAMCGEPEAIGILAEASAREGKMKQAELAVKGLLGGVFDRDND